MIRVTETHQKNAIFSHSPHETEIFSRFYFFVHPNCFEIGVSSCVDDLHVKILNLKQKYETTESVT